MKYFIIYILAIIIVTAGVISCNDFLLFDWADIRRYIIYAFAWFLLLKPAINYWYNKLLEIFK